MSYHRSLGLGNLESEAKNQLLVEAARLGIPTKFPDLPSNSELITQLPSVSEYQNKIESFIGGSDVAKGLATAMGGQASALLGQMSTMAGPYGPAIAIGLKIGGTLLKSLFSDDPPPPKPNIAGVDLEKLVRNPVANTTFAVLSGKIVGGLIDAKGAKKGITENVTMTVNHARRALSKGQTIAQVDKDLDSPTWKSSWRNVCLFSYYVGYDWMLKETEGSDPETRAQTGKMFGWAAPRVAVRELLWNWFLYRMAYSALIGSGGNVSTPIKAGYFRKIYNERKLHQPIPGFYPSIGGRGEYEDWPFSRKLAKVEGGGVETWITQVNKYAVAVPTGKEDGLYVYNPIPKDILIAEAKRYDNNKIRIQDVALPGTGLLTVDMPSPETADHLTAFPENYQQAAAFALSLAAVTESGKRRIAGAKDAINAMKADQKEIEKLRHIESQKRSATSKEEKQELEKTEKVVKAKRKEIDKQYRDAKDKQRKVAKVSSIGGGSQLAIAGAIGLAAWFAFRKES